MKKKKILFISNVDWFFLSHRFPIALEAINQGYEVHLATKFIEDKKVFLENGLITHHLEIHRTKKDIFSLLKTFFNILKVIKKIKPNLVHAITIKPVILGGIASRLSDNTPFVGSISGLGYVFISYGFISRIMKNLTMILYKFAFSSKYKKVIFQNSEDQKLIQKFCNLEKKDTALIHGSGIDLDKYKPIIKKVSTNKILFASRLLKSKGLLEFSESAKELRNSKYEFVIAGKLDKDNPDCIARKQIEEWESNRIIKFIGHNDDIKSLIIKSKIVVLPSYYGEGLPKILIEAAACGVPVITTDHPGCRDAIIPNVTGLLVPIKNSEALSKAILKLLNDDKLCEKMGRAGRELALKKYDINKVVKSHMEIYQQLINMKL